MSDVLLYAWTGIALLTIAGLLAIAFRAISVAHDLAQIALKTIVVQGGFQVQVPTPAPTKPLAPVPTPTPAKPPPPLPAPAKPDRFAPCMAFVWPEEGGFSNDSQDHGGPTNLGVTEIDLEHAGLPHSIDDVKALTKDKAANLIYRPFYWNAMHCDELPAGVDLEVFDLGINAGIHEAAKLLQRDVGTAQDGVIGPLTIAAAHAKSPLDIINTFNNERVTFYKSLKQFDRFGRDWLSRSAHCLAEATKMAKAATNQT